MKPVVRVVPLGEAWKALGEMETEFGTLILFMRSLGNGTVGICAADSEREAKAALAKAGEEEL